MLVVLDNVRDADQVRPLRPASPHCLVLITSRNPLTSLVAREGARPVPLDLLTRHEAIDLLSHHLGRDRVAAELGAAGELVDHCASLPLALALMAARAAVNPRLCLGGRSRTSCGTHRACWTPWTRTSPPVVSERCSPTPTGSSRLPRHGCSASTLGVSYLNTSDHARAISHLRRAVALTSEFGSADDKAVHLDNLGDALRASGDPESARQVWQQALHAAENVPNAEVEHIRAKLRGS